MKARELTIYNEEEVKVIEQSFDSLPPTWLELQFGKLRRLLTPRQESVNVVSQKLDSVKRLSDDVVTTANEDDLFLPRAGLIASSGMLGLLAANRSGLVLRSVFCAGCMVATAGLCHPQQARQITSDVYRTFSETKQQD